MKRQGKLFQVVFPARSSDTVPSWLPWSHDEWISHRAAWFAQLDEVFDIENYLSNFFHVEQHATAAGKEVLAFAQGRDTDSSFPTVHAAEAWQRRVHTWVANLRHDLRQDSVPAPSSGDTHWLLFRGSNMQIHPDTGAIFCSLCKHCIEPLRRVEGSRKRPHVTMPAQARANGMWHGPDPPELQDLSYAECKVINLARIYVSVKRVFLDRSSYARTTKSETPLYHQSNVVAYPV